MGGELQVEVDRASVRGREGSSEGGLPYLAGADAGHSGELKE